MGTRDVEKFAKPVDFGPKRLAPDPREPVVSAPLVGVRLGRRRFFNPPGFHQPLQRAVNRPGAEAQPVARLLLHVLEDRVALELD